MGKVGVFIKGEVFNSSHLIINLGSKQHPPLGPLEGRCGDPETEYRRSWWCESRATIAGDCEAPRMDDIAGALPL